MLGLSVDDLEAREVPFEPGRVRIPELPAVAAALLLEDGKNGSAGGGPGRQIG
jgi:hypothetical protein